MQTTIKQVTKSDIQNLADKVLSTTFDVYGKPYWLYIDVSFGFNQRKNSIGVFKSKSKSMRIEISEWVLENTNHDLDWWEQIMLHEVAHAIDYMRRGTVDHSQLWLSIARQVGYKGGRTQDNVNFTNPKESKYTLTCPVCGNETPGHRKPKRELSCGKCSPRFDRKYLLEVKQNY